MPPPPYFTVGMVFLHFPSKCNNDVYNQTVQFYFHQITLQNFKSLSLCTFAFFYVFFLAVLFQLIPVQDWFHCG